jgi:hypothetical protein
VKYNVNKLVLNNIKLHFSIFIWYYVISYEFTDKLEETKHPQISKKLLGIACKNEELCILHVTKGGSTDCSLFVLVTLILNFESDHFWCVRKIAKSDY